MRFGVNNINIRETDNGKLIIDIGPFTYAVDTLEEAFELIKSKDRK